MMPNAFAQGICLLLFWYAVKGDEFYNFSITDIECIDGNVTVTMICNVINTRNGITIFRNDLKVAFCTTYYKSSLNYCTNISGHHGITNSSIVNDSMIYRIESAHIDNIIGKWVCQNGGPNDPSWSILFPIITCPPKINSAPTYDLDNVPLKITTPPKTDCGPPKVTETPKCDCGNDPLKITTPPKTDCGPPKVTETPKCDCGVGPPKVTETPKCDCGNDMLKKKRVADIFLMLVPLIGCYVFTCFTIDELERTYKDRSQCLCLFCLIGYSVTSIIIMAVDMSIGVTIALTVVCCLVSPIFAFLVVV